MTKSKKKSMGKNGMNNYDYKKIVAVRNQKKLNQWTYQKILKLMDNKRNQRC